MVTKIQYKLPPAEERDELKRCIKKFSEEQALDGESLQRQYNCATKLFYHSAGEEWVNLVSDTISMDVSSWLLELPYALQRVGMIDEALDHGFRWAGVEQRANFLGDRAVILGESGRSEEARNQIAQLNIEFPEDAWVQIKCGDVLLALGDESEAEARYRNAFTVCVNDYDREGMLERFIPLLKKQGRNNEAVIWERHAKAAQTLCMAMRDEWHLSAPDVETIHARREFFEPYFLWSLARRAKVGVSFDLLPGHADVQAIFFLADWGIDRHIPDLLTCLSLSEEDLDILYGDMLTEEMWVPFAKAGQNHIALLQHFIFNTAHYVHARWAVYSGLVAIHHFHPERRTDVVAAAGQILQPPKPFPDDILASLMCDCIESGLTELYDMAATFAQSMGPSEPHSFTADDVLETLESGPLPTFISGRPTDALSINLEWEKANERIADEIESDWDLEEIEEGEFDDIENDPMKHPTPLEKFVDPFAGKIGRNDPCPCGSGKKYKKCHGAA